MVCETVCAGAGVRTLNDAFGFVPSLESSKIVWALKSILGTSSRVGQTVIFTAVVKWSPLIPLSEFCHLGVKTMISVVSDFTY